MRICCEGIRYKRALHGTNEAKFVMFRARQEQAILLLFFLAVMCSSINF